MRQIEKISPLFKMASIDNKIIPDKIRRTVTSHSAEMILSTNKCWDNTPEAPQSIVPVTINSVPFYWQDIRTS